MDLGSGLASSFAVHAGKQDGGTLYLQQSTGVITRVDVIPANNVKSGPIYWKERRRRNQLGHISYLPKNTFHLLRYSRQFFLLSLKLRLIRYQKLSLAQSSGIFSPV